MTAGCSGQEEIGFLNVGGHVAKVDDSTSAGAGHVPEHSHFGSSLSPKVLHHPSEPSLSSTTPLGEKLLAVKVPLNITSSRRSG